MTRNMIVHHSPPTPPNFNPITLPSKKLGCFVGRNIFGMGCIVTPILSFCQKPSLLIKVMRCSPRCIANEREVMPKRFERCEGEQGSDSRPGSVTLLVGFDGPFAFGGRSRDAEVSGCFPDLGICLLFIKWEQVSAHDFLSRLWKVVPRTG